METNTTTTNRTNTRQEDNFYNLTGRAPAGISNLGEAILEHLVDRFKALRAEYIALDFTNYPEYLQLEEQLDFIFARREQAAGAGGENEN